MKKKINIFTIALLLLSVFHMVQSGANEQAGLAPAGLVNTYWRLVELEGQPVKTAEGQREMKFTLREENRVTGYGGCNSFFGSYSHDASALTFSQLAATRKFCADTMDRESLFMKALSHAATYKLTGQTLQLFDDGGQVLASLEAVYLRSL